MAHPALVQALLRPGAYPVDARSARVELVETHVSYLFLTGSYVYKVKKPVDYGFLDFTSLERRRHFCHQEVLLNRRLSPEVYLGVVDVRRDGDSYAVDGPGETVEYAVQMRQLSRSQAMSELLRRRALGTAQVRQVAERVHSFHQAAETGPDITALGGLETVRNNVLENFAQTERYIEQTVSRRDFRRAQAYSQAFLAEREDLFAQRAEAGRIMDGHGDLHSAQIFLDGDVAIIDCIEFNERFRYGDVASDLAFLAMDLDYYRRDDLSRTLVDAYIEASGDRGIEDVLDFYKCYRAWVRGKVTSFRLDDPSLSPQAKRSLVDEARRYFRLASRYARPSGPVLLLTAGLVGTGKSSLALDLAGPLEAEVLTSDVIRKEMAGIPVTERQFAPWGTGLYTEESIEDTYVELHRRAEASLQSGRAVVLDASYRKRSWREAALDIAHRANVPALVLECVAPEEDVRARLERRLRRSRVPSDGRWEIYAQQKASYEPLTEISASEYLIIETASPRFRTSLHALTQVYRLLMRDGEAQVEESPAGAAVARA